jgi:taurine--2-oxoglutarate transaminase
MTMGKAITSGHAPLGAVAVSKRVADHFEAQPLITGLTHSAHPISLAAGLATLEVLRDEKLVERAVTLGATLATRLAAIAARHTIVGDVRSLGLYGVLELVSDRTTKEPLNERRLKAIAGRALDRGVHVATRGNYLFVAPPLCISEADLTHGLDVIETLL